MGLAMQLEFHQLDRRWEHLRVRSPQRQRQLLASLAESGQQTPIVVVAPAGALPGVRWLPTHRGAPATGPGHRGSGGLAAERGRGSAAGPFTTLVRTRNRTGARLAAGGDGAAIRLWTGGTGAAV